MERSPSRRIVTLLVALAASSALIAGCGGGDEEPTASGAPEASQGAGGGTQTLLQAQELTVLDQPIKYPKKTPAQISSAVISLEPGQETGWHRHRVPVYGYVMEGTISVEYDAGVTKEFPAGTAMMQAEDVWHNVTNMGEDPVRILTVYMGAEGKKNLVERAS
jgi:quercetin dioxygenase-like cupin family protein